MEKSGTEKNGTRKPHRTKSKTKEVEEPERRRTNYHEGCYKENNPVEKRVRHPKESGGISEKERGITQEVASKRKDKRTSREKEREIAYLEEETVSASKERKKCSRTIERRAEEGKSKLRDRTNSDETVERKHRKDRRRSSHDSERERKHHRDRKTTRKREKDSSQDDTHDNTRKCYSDSEIEQTRMNISEQDSGSGETKNVDISAMYNLFYKEETRSRKLKEEASVDEKDVKKRGKISFAEANPSEQSNIRGKLIRVLFKKVKELLKETEKLRDERKESMEQIEELSRQVAGLRMRDAEHVTMETQIKERLNVIANDNITNRGTTFRGEVQSILNDIQAKYATHWLTHERNMQEVQTEAETQIQTLMSSIVGKYVKINELHHRGVSSTSRSEQNVGSLNFSTSTLATDEKFVSKTNELLIKDTEQSSNFPSRYLKPLYIDTGPEYGQPVCCSGAFPQRTSDLSGSILETNTVPNQHLLKIADTRTKPQSVRLRTTGEYLQKETITMQEKAKTKEELKEFWRHKLLKPNPLETIRKEQKNRNHHDVSQPNKELTSQYISRNQY